MTSSEDARTIRRSSLRASFSPASAFFERARSSARRSLVSFDSSSTPPGLASAFASGTSVLSFVPVVSGGYQVGVGEDLGHLRNLQDRGGQGLKALHLLLLPLPLCLRKLPLCAVRPCGQFCERAAPHVLAHHAAVLGASPASGVVASPALPFLPRHGASYFPLQSRGGRRCVTQRDGR